MYYFWVIEHSVIYTRCISKERGHHKKRQMFNVNRMDNPKINFNSRWPIYNHKICVSSFPRSLA